MLRIRKFLRQLHTLLCGSPFALSNTLLCGNIITSVCCLGRIKLWKADSSERMIQEANTAFDSLIMAMITGRPHLSIRAIHGCSFHFHDRHTRYDRSSEYWEQL